MSDIGEDENSLQPSNAELMKAIQGLTQHILSVEASVRANGETLSDFMTDITKTTRVIFRHCRLT